jgi:general stress protein 26
MVRSKTKTPTRWACRRADAPAATHPAFHTQANQDMQHLGEMLKGHRVAMLTLFEGPTGLNSRPMTPLEMDANGAIWFMGSRKTLQQHVNTGGEPVNLAFVGDGNYVSIAAKAELVDSIDRKQALWTPAGRPWFSGPEDPDLVLLTVRPVRAEIWDGPDNAVSRAIGMAASVIAGREIGLGHKEVIEPATTL